MNRHDCTAARVGRFSFLLSLLLVAWPSANCRGGAPVALFEQAPQSITRPQADVILIDFGRVAFGNLQLLPPEGSSGTMTVHFGEKLLDGRIDRKPPGTVRYRAASVDWSGAKPLIVAPPADARNTEQDNPNHPPAILTPRQWGVVLPFRWVEIEGWPGVLKADQVVRRAAFAKDWDDDAAHFTSSDELLNEIWELCRYSIKATTFAGVYVDGDRERIPYEADAYLNQLSHYYTDSDKQMARETFDWLMQHGTWPTEWAPHMVLMAHADWMHTGDQAWLAERYESLKTKLLLERAGTDGLIRSNQQQRARTDIVDWPKGERDGYVFTEINTVVNAFHIAALQRMAVLAQAVNKRDDAAEYSARAQRAQAEFQRQLLDEGTGLYRDGVGTDHSALHANFFPLAFDITPASRRDKVLAWLREQDMNCSVYAAQYLLEALFQHGSADKALALITARNDRSWRHMVESGTTISWEAWDQKYKPNQDWNHAWGAAPANLLPRFVLGAEPLEPGWRQAVIRPCPGGLAHAKGKIPTVRGPLLVAWQQTDAFEITVTVPPGMTARLELPATANSKSVTLDGQPAAAQRSGDRWIIQNIAGTATLRVQ